MSSIIHITNKSSGITYAYESHSYWDKEAKAPRTRRIYLGRVDENGNIIPKKDKATVPKETDPDVNEANYKKLYDHLSLENTILKEKIQSLEAELSAVRKALLRLSKLCDSQKECLNDALLSLKTDSNEKV